MHIYEDLIRLSLKAIIMGGTITAGLCLCAFEAEEILEVDGHINENAF